MVLYPVVTEVNHIFVGREGEEMLSWGVLGEGAGEGLVVKDGTEKSDRALVGVNIKVKVEVKSFGGPAETVADIGEIVEVPGEDEVEWLGSVSNEVDVESEVDEEKHQLDVVSGGDLSKENWVHHGEVVFKHVPEDWHLVSKVEVKSEIETNSPSVARPLWVPVEGLNSWESIFNNSSELLKGRGFLEGSHGQSGGSKGSNSSKGFH